jgi:hypothetical protein
MKHVVWCVLCTCACVSPQQALVRAGWRAEHAEVLASVWSGQEDRRRVAVLDWDNTVIKNDIGDGFVWWMLQHNGYRQPQNKDWGMTSPWLSLQAVHALGKACEQAGDALQVLKTAENPLCLQEIACVYWNEKTCGGEEAFVKQGYDHRKMQPAYAWAAQLLAGYTPQQITHLAKQAVHAYLQAPLGSSVDVLPHKRMPGYIRVYAPMQALIQQLHQHGVEVWVLSASPQAVVEAFAQRVGIAASRVVGIQSVLDVQGVYTHHLQGCGVQVHAYNQVMTYMDGKRCFMNERIFHVPSEKADMRQQDMFQRPVLAAGDASTDVSFVRDALWAHVVVDRQHPELMCWASANQDTRWIVTPMFIEPLHTPKPTYACTQNACQKSDGSKGGCW